METTTKIKVKKLPSSLTSFREVLFEDAPNNRHRADCQKQRQQVDQYNFVDKAGRHQLPFRNKSGKLCDVARDPPRLIFAEQLGGRPLAPLISALTQINVIFLAGRNIDWCRFGHLA
jgi:hypothetical protein